MVVFWAVVVVAPAIAALIAIAQFPPGIEIPVHWDVQSRVDSWGAPWVMLFASFIMVACNLLLALMYLFSDRLYDLGLVHGISRKATRPLLCGTAVFMVLVLAAILVYWVGKALPYVA